MLAALIDFCIIDDLPLDQSKAYRQLVNFCGTDLAGLFVEEREIEICSHPPPEVMEDGRYIGVISTAS